MDIFLYKVRLPGQAIIQPETVAAGAKMLVSIYPSIPFLLSVGLLFFYVIDKKMEVKIEADLNARREKVVA